LQKISGIARAAETATGNEEEIMSSPVIHKLMEKTRRTDIPEFDPGDTVRVHVRIKEGDKERTQVFEGLVIAKSRGMQPSFTVRKMSFGQGVERIFPVNSKVVDKLEVVRSAKIRRAKLYYLRALRGKAARLREAEKKTS
jgi:large subunit ribosomal protein L19